MFCREMDEHSVEVWRRYFGRLHEGRKLIMTHTTL